MSKEAYTHGYESMSEMMAARGSLEVQFVGPFIKPGMSVLDVGCGPGSITKNLAQLAESGRVVGIDIAEGEVERARSATGDISNLEFQVGDSYELAFDDDSFDFAYSNGMLEHLKEPKRALKEMKRVVRTDGFIAIRSTDVELMYYPRFEQPDMRKAVEAYKAMWRHNGGNPSYGRQQREALRNLELQVISITGSVDVQSPSEYQATIGAQFKSEPVKQALLALGVLSEDEYAAAVVQMDDFSDEQDHPMMIPWYEAIARV